MTAAEMYLETQDRADRARLIRKTTNADLWDSIERIIRWSAIISGAAAIIFVIIPALMVIWRQG